MTHGILFGFLADQWVTNWLTPIWMLSVGVTLGLAALLVLWGLFWVISRIPGVGTLAADVPRARKAAVGLGAILALAALSFLFTQLTLPGLFLAILPVAIVSWVVAFALLMMVWRRNVDEIPIGLTEGIMGPIGIVALVMVGFAAFGSLIAYHPMELMDSVARLPTAGTVVHERTVPLLDPPDRGPLEEPTEQTLSLTLRGAELRSLVIESDQPLSLSPLPFDDTPLGHTWEVAVDEPYTWTRGGDETVTGLPEEHIEELYVMNHGAADARATFTADTAPPHPEVATIPFTAAVVVLLFLLYFGQRAAMPKVSAIALSTAKTEIAQPLFLLLLVGGSLALLLFILIPYHTLGEDIKMLKDSGLTLIMVLAIFLAIWAASTSVSEEIEGRTALTVLSKPVGRASFIMGKFTGIVWTVALLFIVLGLVFMTSVSYKAIYDAREGSHEEPTWQITHYEVMGTVPGLTLAFMEATVFVALSVAISTRLPMLANFVICFAIYVLGHLTPLIVQTSREGFEIVRFVGQLIATVIPVLDHFNIQAAVAAGATVPVDYLGWTFVYCLIFCVIALMLALLMFEDRDLA